MSSLPFSSPTPRRLVRWVRWITCLALLTGALPPSLTLAREPDAEPSLPVRPPVAQTEQAAAPSAPQAVGVVATKDDMIITDVDNDGLADSGDIVRYTVIVSNTGTTTATDVLFNDTIDDNSSLSGIVRVSPLARDDAFSAIGNTLLAVGVTPPANTPAIALAGSLFSNDSEFLGDTFTLASFSALSANNGTVNVNASGGFTYLPAAGFTGVDTFTYTITDGSLTSVGTVTITVANRVWYVDTAAAAGGTGRSTSPFNTVAPLNNTAIDVDGANDYIFLNTGGASYGPLTLENGQRLIGRGVALVVGGTTLLAAGTFPTLAAGGSTGVTTAQNNTIRGINITASSAGTGIAGSNFGTLTVDNTRVNGGSMLNLTTGTLNGDFLDLSSTGAAGAGVSLTTVDGTLVAPSSSSITGVTGTDFFISGGTVAVTYPGSITNSTTGNRSIVVQSHATGAITFGGTISDLGTGVLVQNNTSGTITFSGASKTFNTGANAAITLDTNTNTTIQFTGGSLSVTTSTGTGMNITGGGTVTVSGTANTVTATAGKAINMTGTTSGGMTFQSVSAAGGVVGVTLNGIGAGGFTITGTGTTDASGGTIQNMDNRGIEVDTASTISLSNMRFTNATENDNASCAQLDNLNCNAAIYLNGVTGAALTNVDINGTVQYAVSARNTSGFSLDGSTVQNCGDESDESCVRLVNLSGTASINNSDLALNPNLTAAGGERVIRLTNTSGSLTLNLNNTTIRDTQTATFGGTGLLVEAQSTAVINLDVRSSFFRRLKTLGIQVQSIGTATVTVNVRGTLFDRGTGIGRGIELDAEGGSTLNANLINNVVNAQGGIGILAFGKDTARLNARINDNTVTIAAGSGSGIVARATNASPQMVVEINNNTVTQNGFDYGIAVDNGDPGGNSRLDASVTNNRVTLNANSLYAILLQAANNHTVCGDVSNNAVTLNGGTLIFRERTSVAGATIILQGYNPPQSGFSTVAEVWQSRGNTPTAGGTISQSNPAGTLTGGTCTDVSHPNLPALATVPAADAEQEPAADAEQEPAADAEQEPAADAEAAPAAPEATAPTAGAAAADAPAPEADLVSVPIGVLPPGKRVTIIFNVQVKDPLVTLADFLSNQATISGSNFANVLSNDPATVAPNDPTLTPLDARTNLKLTKSDGNASAVPGGIITYTLTISNAGPLLGQAVVLTETVPLHTVFNAAASSPGWSCAPSNNAGATCTLAVGDVAKDAIATRAFAVTVVNPVAAGVTSTTNTASVGANRRDIDNSDNTASDTTPIVAQPQFSITKSDGGASVAPGGTVAYTLSYTNAGNQGATGVRITETVPLHTSFNPGASTVGWSCVPNNNAGATCTFNVGNLAGGGAGGSVTFGVTVVNPVAAGVSQISNTATIGDNGANGADPIPANNSSTDTTPLNATPDLTITKSDGGASVTPGNTVVYTLTYANVGNQGATGVTLSERVPSSTTFTPGASTPGWVCVPNNNALSNCTLAVGDLAAGASGSATFAVTVDSSVPALRDEVSNTASVADNGANGADPTPANNSSTDTTPLNAAPDLSLSKTDGGVSVAPGGTVVYTLSYTNSGNQNASSVWLTEQIPANTTYNASASIVPWVCSPNISGGSTCLLFIDTLNAGSSGSVKFAVTVVNPVAAGVNQISNTASISDGSINGTDPTPANNIASDTTPVNAAPDLRITKSDGGTTAGPLDVIAYTLIITNTGNQGAAGVVITETVPLHTSFNAAASAPGWSCANGAPAGTICILTVGGLNAGANASRTFAVTVVDPLPGGVTQTTNTATVRDDGANGADPTPANNTGSDTTPLSASPDLTITKSDGGVTAAPGGTVIYTLSFANNGTRAASGVRITETVPLHTVFNPGASSPGWACLPNDNAGSVCTLAIGALAGRGGSGSRTFAVTVVNPAPAGVNQISNTASIGDDGAGGPDANPADNSGTDTTPLNATPDLSITKSDGSASVAPGGTVAYSLTYGNVGNQGASGVVITETVPLHTSFNAGASSPGWVCAPTNNAGSTCTLNVGGVAGGGAGTSITFAVTVINPVPAGVNQISNTATIGDNGANGADPTPGNNTGSDTTPLNAAPDLTISKSDGGASVAPGGTVAYTLSYGNAGNQGASGVVITETVPANTTFNAGASTAGWTCAPTNNAGSTCTLAIGSLAAGASGNATFAVTVVNPVAAGVSQISNTATIADDTANGADPTPANNSASDTTPVNAAPTLTLTKSDSGVTVVPGSGLAYNLSITNTGNQGATGVVITETVPLHTVFNSAISTPGWVCAPNNNAGSVCTQTIGNLGAGLSSTQIFAVTVVNPVPAGVEQINNTATASDNGANSASPATATASETTPVNAAPNLAITKSDGGITTAPGQTVIYTLNITNTGNQSASGVVITETVPANTTYASGGWSCAPNNNAGSTCTRSIGNLSGGGANTTLSFGVTVANPVASGVTQISNTASIADDGAGGPDSNPANNSASDTTPLTAAPALALGKSDGGVSVGPGGTVAYTLSITNTGNQVASGVVLTETVPANATFNAGASTAGWVCAPSGNAGSTCTLSVGSVATTASAVFAVTVASPVPAGVTQISNSASVADDGSNGLQASASASDTTPLNITLDLSISKSVNPTIANAGNQIVYTIRFTSTGNTIAEGVRITDTLPAQVTINTIQSSGVVITQTSNAPTLAWLAAPLAPGATGIITLTGEVNAGVTTEQDVTNTVTIAHPQETAPANNTATATFTVNLSPVAVAGGPYNVNEGSTVVLSASGSSDPGNDTLTYAWDLDNNGSYEAAGVSVTFSNTADNGVFTVGLRVTDTEGATATTTATVNVINVAPSVNAGPDRTTTPNQTLTFAGSFSDPGLLDTHTIAWDFGDGGSATGTLSPTHAFSLPGTYTVTLTVTDDDNGIGTDTLRVVVANNRVYLPLITRAQPAPDLVVQNITTTGTSISVVLRNQGDAPVTDAFWVDLYLNPNPAPTAVNQIWQSLSQYGMVWGVTQNALPLQPGQSLTLTTRGLYFRGDLSSFPATIPTGTQIYVQVDSANANTTYGAVREGHERDGLAYNNIFGPRATAQAITIPAAREDTARPDASLPQRPDAANR